MLTIVISPVIAISIVGMVISFLLLFILLRGTSPKKPRATVVAVTGIAVPDKPLPSTAKPDITPPSATSVATSGYNASYNGFTCNHGPFGERKFLTIKGKRVGIAASPFCEVCTVAYFEKYA